jgi:hypothetical protein
MISEAAFQVALDQALNMTSDIRVARVNSGDVTFRGSHGDVRRFRGATKGTGDLVGLVAPDGRHLEVECKSATGRPTEAQAARAQWVNRMGGVYVVVKADKYDLDKSVSNALETIRAEIAKARNAHPTCDASHVLETGFKYVSTRRAA